MSGDKQHYIPRSLLRGFTHRVGKDGSVLVIKKDKRYVSNITDVAAERHFYGMPGAGSLDDLITDFEGRFRKFFHDLRMQSRSAPLNARMIANMLAHLSLRSMAIRSTQTKMMVDFLQGFEHFGASESSVGLALDQFISDDRWLRNLIRKEAGRSGQRIDGRQLKELMFQARQKFRDERQDMIGGVGLDGQEWCGPNVVKSIWQREGRSV